MKTEEKFICLSCGELLNLSEIRARSGKVECSICLEKEQIIRAADILKTNRVQNELENLTPDLPGGQ